MKHDDISERKIEGLDPANTFDESSTVLEALRRAPHPIGCSALCTYLQVSSVLSMCYELH